MKYILLIQILLLILITAILGCGSENSSFINEPQSSATSLKGSKSITDKGDTITILLHTNDPKTNLSWFKCLHVNLSRFVPKKKINNETERN